MSRRLDPLLPRLRALAAGALLALAASPALADDDRLDDAWADLALDQEPILTEAQFAKLNNLAFQAAATKVCDGFELDQKKFTDGLASALDKAPQSVTADQMGEWETAAYFRFGASYGIFLAEGNAKPDGFCANATELKADTTVPNVWQ